jgi:hypothetical protein
MVGRVAESLYMHIHSGQPSDPSVLSDLCFALARFLRHLLHFTFKPQKYMLGLVYFPIWIWFLFFHFKVSCYILCGKFIFFCFLGNGCDCWSRMVIGVEFFKCGIGRGYNWPNVRLEILWHMRPKPRTCPCTCRTSKLWIWMQWQGLDSCTPSLLHMFLHLKELKEYSIFGYLEYFLIFKFCFGLV